MKYIKKYDSVKLWPILEVQRAALPFDINKIYVYDQDQNYRNEVYKNPLVGKVVKPNFDPGFNFTGYDVDGLKKTLYYINIYAIMEAKPEEIERYNLLNDINNYNI